MGLSQQCSCLCGLDNLKNVQRQTDFVSRSYISCCVQLCLLNVISVKNKAMIMKDYVVDNDIDIMALAETWLRPGNTDDVEVGYLCPTGYRFLHVPRSHSRGGGVGVLFKDNLNINSSMCDTFQSFEFMDVRPRSLQCIRILVIYRPPDNNSCLLFFEEFSRLLEQIAAEPSGCLLITGDFNFHMDDPDNANAKRFADLLESYDLKQHVNCGTHTSGHTLDLVITRSDDSLIKDTKVKDPVISDHLAINCVLSILKPQFRKKLINVRKLHSLNMDSFCKDIMDSPLLQDQATDLDMMVDQYDRVLRQLLD